MKLQQESDWKSDLPLFSYGYQKYIFVDSLTEYTEVLPIMFTIEFAVVLTKFEDIVQSILNIMGHSGVCSLILT